ncbi:UNVERIFIED_CONTAM: hypothetical protein HDU68_007381 [Siphonaria sp. JEL0065]|nr:hypothetical protein HDU68_007381 [Siphonaria sp. JEL0065]
MWTSSLSFAIVAASLIVKNARIGLIFAAKQNLPKAMLKDQFVGLCAFIFAAVQLILLISWTMLSKLQVTSISTASTSITEYSCTTSKQAKPIEYVITAYNILAESSIDLKKFLKTSFVGSKAGATTSGFGA